jgi:mono/diheme cytochrome c family protein
MKKIIWNIGFSLLTASAAIAAGDANAGKAAYDKACKSCHGVDGKPNPAIAKAMKVDMLHLGDPAVQKLGDDELRSCITNGKGKMKAIKSVGGTAADDAVAYIRTFKK